MASVMLTSSPTATGFFQKESSRVCVTRAEFSPPTSTSGRCRLSTAYSTRLLSTHLLSDFSASRLRYCARSNGRRSPKERYMWQASAASSVESTVAGDLSDVPQPVLVVGATGGVGQLCVAALLEGGASVTALMRDSAKAKTLFGNECKNLEVITGDLRYPNTLRGKFAGVRSVIVCTGTTAFPSQRWGGGNGPEQTDLVGTKNLLEALPQGDVERLVFVSSVGVTRYDQLPFSILNLFGVLKFKKMAEELVEASSIPYTILRPGRLTDGPYTSYDLNTLLKATAGIRRAAVLEQGDSLQGEASRILVAECACQMLANPATQGKAYTINSTEGEGPGKDRSKWQALFASTDF